MGISREPQKLANSRFRHRASVSVDSKALTYDSTLLTLDSTPPIAHSSATSRIIYFNLSGKTTKQLMLHSLSRPRTFKYLTNDIRAGRKVILEDRLASTPHISQDCLPAMPT
jgi:hypothetical protein